MKLGINLGISSSKPQSTVITQAVAILRRFGSDAHVYLPGIGTISGLQAANYLDSALTTPATVDNPVGGVVDAIGVINATQPTTAAKPRLERGVRNLLTRSSDFSNAAWTKTGSSFSGGKLQEDASVSGHTATQAFTPTAGTTYTAAIALKAAERGFALFGINGGGVAAAFASVNLSTGAMSVATGSPLNLTSVYTSDGYWLVTASIAAVSTASMPVDVRVSTDGVWANRVYQGVAGSGVLIQGSALFQGTLTAAQILAEGGIPLTTTAAASNPSAGKYSWAFDGNDSLALGSVPFQMSDDFFVIAGANIPATKADASTLFSSGDTVSGVGYYALDVSASGSLRGIFKDNPGVQDTPTYNTNVTGSAMVASIVKVGNNKSLRHNGVERASASTVLGASTLNTALIGARSVVVTPSNYTIGSQSLLIVGKGTLTDSEMLTIERMVANLTPNAPSF